MHRKSSARPRVVACLLGAAALCSTAAANAALYTNDFGSLVGGYVPNDDAVFTTSLPFTMQFFGGTYTTAVVSNNGNVQFGTSSGSFSPAPLNTTTVFRGIAPYWTDLYSSSDPLGGIAAGTGGSGVYVRAVSPSEVVFTWDRLGYFPGNYAARVQFQLVLRDPNAAVPAGEGSIGFFYGAMAAPASGSAAIGFGDGQAAVNPGEISVFSGARTDAVSYANRVGSIWFGLSGGVPVGTEVPEPATLGLLGAGLLGLVAVRRRRSR